MASIVIRRLDDRIRDKLRLRASRRGHSMEQEVREILGEAVAAKPEKRSNLAEAIRKHIEPLGGMELTIPRRERLPKPIDLNQ